MRSPRRQRLGSAFKWSAEWLSGCVLGRGSASDSDTSVAVATPASETRVSDASAVDAPAEARSFEQHTEPRSVRDTQPVPSGVAAVGSTAHPARRPSVSASPEQAAAQFALLGERMDLLVERVDLLRERIDLQTSTRQVPDRGYYEALRAPRMPGLNIMAESGLPTAMPGGVPVESGFSRPSVSGSLDELSLTSLLGLFELERSEGVLLVESAGRRLEIEVREGVPRRAYLDRRQSSLVAAVRDALNWRGGTFSFAPAPISAGDEDEPRSVNAIVLEASRQHDEAAL